MKRFTIIISFIMLTFMTLMAQVKQTVAVLGDSYSTFEGFIPKGYATWYSPTTPAKTTDVNKVEQTWWWQVIKEGGYKMGNINSYSGATICNTGYNDVMMPVISAVLRKHCLHLDKMLQLQRTEMSENVKMWDNWQDAVADEDKTN